VGIPALHAAALAPDKWAAFSLRQTLVSWSSVIQTPLPNRHLTNTVHGALHVYDLPDLVRLIGPDRLTIVEPVDAAGEVIK